MCEPWWGGKRESCVYVCLSVWMGVIRESVWMGVAKKGGLCQRGRESKSPCVRERWGGEQPLSSLVELLSSQRIWLCSHSSLTSLTDEPRRLAMLPADSALTPPPLPASLSPLHHSLSPTLLLTPVPLGGCKNTSPADTHHREDAEPLPAH